MQLKMPRRKLVYPISQVCRMTGLSDKEIKSWEKKFPQVKPVRHRGRSRYYAEKDVKLIFYIRDLIYVRKLELDDVREKLKKYNPMDDEDSPAVLKNILAEIKMEVEEIQQLLDN